MVSYITTDMKFIGFRIFLLKFLEENINTCVKKESSQKVKMDVYICINVVRGKSDFLKRIMYKNVTSRRLIFKRVKNEKTFIELDRK